jgi:hypothetical protein
MLHFGLSVVTTFLADGVAVVSVPCFVLFSVELVLHLLMLLLVHMILLAVSLVLRFLLLVLMDNFPLSMEHRL